MKSVAAFSFLALALGLGALGAAQAADCTGNCGTLGANGVVSSPPSGADSYTWVSTYLGQNGAGQIAGYGGTNGSALVSDPFYAAAGSSVEFWFNYVTSDGAEYTDYGWAELRGSTTTTLFTARTEPTGSIVPGLGLPGVKAVLTPASVPIVPGAPQWAPLGTSTGQCYDAGCGYTGWVKSTYTVPVSGTYRLAFGVTNWLDSFYDSGMAFQGLLVNGSTIGDGSSPTSPLQPINVGPDGSFQFTFTPTPMVPIFIDPLIAIGYDYQITAGSNRILKVVLPVLAGDLDGYQIYALGNISAGGLLGTVLGGQTFSFAGNGVTGFSVRGIDEAAVLDPSNPTAFVTGLTFATSEVVSMSQIPVTVEAVPEASSWLLMAVGLAALVRPARRPARSARITAA
jgi:hypothetical protein